jgi:CheY-like chemotaxis protein
MVYTILVIDDSEDDTYFFKRAIAAIGLDVQLTCLSNGLAALDTIRNGAFDCVFLDYNMPDMDGLTILKKLKQANIDTPVIMLTGQKDEQTIVKLMQAGATDYLQKLALSPDSLRISIENARKVYLMRHEKALAEEALKTSEGRLAEAQHIAHIGNWEHCFKDDSFFLSEEARNIIGALGFKHFTFLSFCRKIHRQDFLLFKTKLRQLKKENSYDFTIRFFITPGDMKNLNLKGRLAYGNKAVGTIQDITVLKTALLDKEKADVKSRASSIVLIIAIIIFFLSEAVLDPLIDSLTASLLISLSFKGSIAIALKPIEVLLKRIMMSRLITN